MFEDTDDTEGDETVKVRVEDSADTTRNADFTITISDGTAASLPVVTIAAKTTSAVTEGSNAEWTVTASPAPTSSLAVSLALDIPPGTDFVLTSHAIQSVTIPANTATATFTYSTRGDDNDEPSGPVTATVRTATGYTVGTASSASVTVNDDDRTVVTLSGTPDPVTESQTKTFTVTLGRGLYDGEVLAVPLTFGGAATRNTDYQVTCAVVADVTCANLNSGSATVTFTGPETGASSTSVTLTLTALADGTAESDESVVIGLGTLNASSGTNLGGGARGVDSLANFNIENFSLPYTVTFDETSFIVSEADGVAVVTGSISPRRSRATRIEFRYTTHNAHNDFRPVTWAAVPPGETAFTLRIPIGDDKLIEDNEVFRVFVRDAPSVNTDVIIIDDEAASGYVYRIEEGNGIYACKTAGPSIYLTDSEGGTIEVPQVGAQVYPLPPGLVVDWDRTRYEVGDTAKIRFRTSDGSRSCNEIGFKVYVDQRPRRWQGAPRVLSWRDRPAGGIVWLRRGKTETEASFEVTAPGEAYFQIERLTKTGHTETPMPVPVDRNGNALTVSSDLTAATEVSRTFCADCVAGTVSFATASREVREDAGVVNLEVTLDPPPSSSFALTFSLSGTAAVGTDYTVPGRSGNTGSVLVPANAGSVTFPVTIIDDAVDDDGETITVRLWTVGSPHGYTDATPDRVTLTIRNDDPLSEAQVGQLPIGHPVAKYATLVKAFHDRLTTKNQHGNGAAGGWNKRFLKAMGHPQYVDYPQAAVTVADATRLWNHGGPGANTVWKGTVEAVTYAEKYFAGLVTARDPASGPEVTIAAGSGITEGGSAVFTLTATPAPAAPLDVTVTVAASGDYGITAGTRTVTIPTTGSATLTLATTGDEADEADGSVTVTVDAGTGYTVGDASSGSVAIADDDASAPATTAAALPGTVAGPVSNGAVTLARPSGWTGSGKVQFGGGSKARDRSKFTTLRIGNVDDDSFEVTWASREPGTLRLTLEWQPMAGSSWHPSDGDARDPRVLTVEDPAPAQPAPQEEQQTAGPEIAIAAGDGITEGGSATFTLTATPAPAAALEVTVTIAATGDYGVAAGERTVTIPTTGSHELTLATLGDGTDEPDGSVSVTVKAGTGYTVGASSSGTVAIADDDLPPPEISVSAGTGITEGGNATFTVTADRAPDANLAVTLNVTEKAGSDFVAAADEGTKTVTIPAGATSAALTVATVDDGADEPDGSVTATLAGGSGYTVAAAPGNAASLTVADNDVAASGPPVVSVEDVTVREGGTAVVPVTLSPAPTEPVWLVYKSVYAPSGAGKGATLADFKLVRGSLRFGAGETLKHARVPTKQDSHDDGGEVFQVMVIPLSGAVPATGVFATVTIENDDPMPAAYLARFGRTVAEQALDGIAGRMSADRTPGMQGTVAGQALTFDPAASDRATVAGATPGTMPADRQAALAMAEIARGLGAGAPAGPGSVLSGAGGAGPGGAADRFGGGHGWDHTHGLGESRTMTARDALLGSSFSLTGQTDGAGGSLAFWGRASQGSFDGAERGDGTDITLDGTVTTGMLGADYARGNWLVGLALTQSSSEGSYAAMGGGDEGDGKVEASLTAAIPYAALRASERLKLWGAAGYGAGEVTLKTAMGERLSADTSWTMAAAGVRGDLLAPPDDGSGGPALALTSDALWARTSSEKGDLPATDSDVTRLRLGLEGSYRIAMEEGASLTPKLEIGARHDGGDAETGFGIEVGGGIAWVDPSLGLSLDLSGRTLLAHENDDLKDRGFSAALGFDPAPATRRGPSFSLRQDFGGQAQGGLDALFATDPLEDRAGSEATSRWALEAAYGLPVFGDRFTGSPHVGFGLATGARDYSLGWRLTPEAATAPDLSFGVKATRRESDTAGAEHQVGFEITARW